MNATERFKECRDLLARGIDVHARDHDGRTALLHAAKHGYGGVVDELLRAGADPNARDNRGSTGLIYATAIGYESIATALIGAGAAVDVVDNFGRNALCLAAANRAADTVTAILQTPGGGRLLDVRGHPLDDSNRMAPLVAAAAAGSRSVVRVIIKYLIQQNQLLAPAAVSDADMPADAGPADAGMPSADKRGLNVRGARGATALINAAAYGDLDMVRDLVHAGAALDLEDDDGNTALRVARDHHHEAVRQLLIAAGARCPRSAHRARS